MNLIKSLKDKYCAKCDGNCCFWAMTRLGKYVFIVAAISVVAISATTTFQII
jgi:hypothetical protein